MVRDELHDDHYLHVMHLRVPLNIALGLYERLTDEQLIDHRQDIQVEIEKRNLNDRIRSD